MRKRGSWTNGSAANRNASWPEYFTNSVMGTLARLGLRGSALVTTCVDFARYAGYESITLWTQSILLAARHLYQTVGFRLVASEAARAFGHDLVSETESG